MSKPQRTRAEVAGKETEVPAAISDLFDYAAFVKVAAAAFGLVMIFIIAYRLLGTSFLDRIQILSPKAAYDSGKRMEQVGDYDAAIEHFRQALHRGFADEGTKRACLLSLGSLLYRQKQYVQAIDAYQQLPLDAFASVGDLTGYVGALWRQGDYDEAERLGKIWLDKAESADEVQQLEWAHYTLGRIYQETNRSDEALAHYRAVAKLNPESPAKINIARILHGRGQDVEALRWLDEFLSVFWTGDLHEQARALRAQIAGQADEP